MPTNIFSTYATNENRVTASILAVLQSLSLARSTRLLGAILERQELELIRFQNQPAKGGQGVPDAIIRASCHILIETKVKANTVDADQVARHLERLEPAGEDVRALLVLTPDDHLPTVLEQMQNPLIAWASFTALDQAIEELLADPQEVVSEREEFLLRELQAMLANEGLIATADNVVIVAARHAWPEYERYHAYICQPNRTFQPVRRMAFYAGGSIQSRIPLILESRRNIEFRRGRHTGQVGKLVEELLDDHVRTEGATHDVMLLSAPESDRTVKLTAPVRNDLTSESGRPWAFTLGQRYVALDRLRKAKTTSELIDR